MVLQIASDTQLHKYFFTAYLISLRDVELTQEEPELITFTRYVLDIGLRGDEFLLSVALTPCIVGYGEIGMGLKRKGAFEDETCGRHGKRNRVRLNGNPYQQ